MAVGAVMAAASTDFPDSEGERLSPNKRIMDTLEAIQLVWVGKRVS